MTTQPTRGDSNIDLFYINSPEAIKENLALPPLHVSGGADSDHRCVFIATTFKENWKFQWTVRLQRTRNQAREEAFAAELQGWYWGNFGKSADLNRMAGGLESVIAESTEKHFPLARVRRGSTRQIKRLWKRKIRLYKKGDRCNRWWEANRVLQECNKKSREAFVEKMLDEGNKGRSFYAATRKLSNAA